MSARNPDVAALSEAAYEAADKALNHIETCGECSYMGSCDAGCAYISDYRSKKEKALKAIRGAGKKGKKGDPSPKTAPGRGDAPKKEFRLEVGKYYKSRGGLVFGPMEIWSKTSHPYGSKGFGQEHYCWNAAGESLLSHERDLIREVPAPKTRRAGE